MPRDQYACVALSRVPGVGSKLFRALVHHFGSASDVLYARPHDLTQVDGVAERTASAFATDTFRREAESIVEHAERYDYRILCWSEPDYPGRLLQFDTAPAVLYLRGTVDLENPRSLAVVGTRTSDAYGRRQVERLLDPLVGYDPLIVSGLAMGIDKAAHQQALNLGLKTVAVMASGLNHVYPHYNRELARRMVDQGGGLLTEYPYWIRPDRERFPARNRIVAMLTDAVVVAQSRREGGSMITAGMAKDYGRPLGACPGRSNDDLHAGCNYLIRTGRAHLMDGGKDVIELLRWTGEVAGKQRRLFDDLEPPEMDVVDRLRDREAVAIDELRYELSVPPSALASTLLMLEVKGVVSALPGQRYRLTG